MESGILSLSRNEVIALINTAAQLGKSVGSLRSWRLMSTRNCIFTSLKTLAYTGASVLCAIYILLFVYKRLIIRKKKKVM